MCVACEFNCHKVAPGACVFSLLVCCFEYIYICSILQMMCSSWLNQMSAVCSWSLSPVCQSSRDKWRKGQIWPHAMFVHYVCCCLFISFALNICVSSYGCVRATVCMHACAHTTLPTGLCDHIPADMLFRSLVTSAGVSKWQGLFVWVLICSEETGTDSRRRQEEESHNKSPPPPHPARHKMSSFPWLRRTPSHPAEKSRHLKLCDMCHRHCHWASATDGAGIDRPRATGAGWGTHRVWCVSLPILVRDASWAATPTQTALWNGWGVAVGADIWLTCTFVYERRRRRSQTAA